MRARSTSLPLRCTCGRVRGVAADVSPSTVNHAVCYCDDCQAFARWLGTPGIVDAAGGTEIVQMAPARVHIEQGADALRCLRLSDRGLFRWYADCCRTPVANTVAARFPLAGVIRSFVGEPGAGRRLDEVAGPPDRIHGRFAVGAVPPGTHRTVTVRGVARAARKMLSWWLRGLATPSPFFDPRTGAPRSGPRVLTPAERDALR